jgi:hypothetical protein
MRRDTFVVGDRFRREPLKPACSQPLRQHQPPPALEKLLSLRQVSERSSVLWVLRQRVVPGLALGDDAQAIGFQAFGVVDGDLDRVLGSVLVDPFALRRSCGRPA